MEKNSKLKDSSRERWAIRSATPISFLTYALLAAAIYWPATPWNASNLPATPYGGYGFGDPAQMTWFLAWVPHAIIHGLNPFQTNYLDYPHGVNLAANTLSPLLGLVGSPVTLTLGPVATFNVMLRLAFATSAFSMFWVLRRRCRWSVAFVGGLVYGFGPYVVSQGQTHLDLAFVPLPPLIVWCFYELLIARNRRPQRIGLLLGLLAGAQVLIDLELLVLLAIVISGGVFGGAIMARAHWREWLIPLKASALPSLSVFLASTGYFFWWMIAAPGHLNGPVLAPASLQLYRADLLGPLVPTFSQWLVPTNYFATAAHYVGGNFTENSTYLGVPLVVLFVSMALRWRRDRIVFVSSLLAVIAFVLSLGERLTIDAHATSIPLPEAVLVHLPFLASTVPARFSLVVAVFVVVTAALGLEHEVQEATVGRAKHWRHSIRRSLLVVLVMTTVVTLLPKVPFVTGPPAWPTDTLRALNVISAGSVVLTYPYAIGIDTEAMSWAAEMGMRFRLMGGYATVQDFPTYGDSYPPLIEPTFVQEYLVQSQDASQVFYPRPSHRIDPVAALCNFISRYRVGDVVWWRSGTNPLRVRRLFERALGRPRAWTAGRTVLVWSLPSRRC